MLFRLRLLLHEVKHGNLPLFRNRNLNSPLLFRENRVRSLDILVQDREGFCLTLIFSRIQRHGQQCIVHLLQQFHRLYGVCQLFNKNLSTFFMVKVLRIRPFHFVRQVMIEAHHPHCHLFPFIDRHPGVIRRFQVLTVTDKPVNSACGLIPVQMNACIRVPVWATLQRNAPAIVIFVGIVCPAECMAAAADSVMVFQEVCPLFLVLMIQEERIDCQPAVRIIAASCEISVYFIFRNELLVLIPVKAISCGKILIRLCKLLEQSRNLIRLIKVHPHQVFIFGIGFPQRGQSFIEIGQKIRVIQQVCQPVCQFRETAPEDFCILKHFFGNAIG